MGRSYPREQILVAVGPPMRLCSFDHEPPPPPPPTTTRADAVATIKRIYPVSEWRSVGMRFLGSWTREDNEMWADV